MSTFIIRPLLSYGDVQTSLGLAFVNLTKHMPEEDEYVSPYEVFQAVAAALQVRLREMVDCDLDEVTFHQMDD